MRQQARNCDIEGEGLCHLDRPVVARAMQRNEDDPCRLDEANSLIPDAHLE